MAEPEPPVNPLTGKPELMMAVPPQTTDTFGGSAGELTVQHVTHQVQLIQQVMAAVMKRDVHYGVIPGCKEPSLWKPGAEKILATFRLMAEPETVEFTGSQDEPAYRVTLRIVHYPTGRCVGYGMGSCSCREEKYKWRKAKPGEFDLEPPDRQRTVQREGRNGKYEVRQIRTPGADVDNTILKMAFKRAMVAGCLSATAASDVFTQDLEDMPEELREKVAGSQGGNQGSRTENGNSSGTAVDSVVILRQIEQAKTVDELTVIREGTMCTLKGKDVVNVGAAWRERLAAIAPEMAGK